jgi:ArsR family transcriptional regulator, arsenate/arsenite/antimonite-responsive transcriptional repressor
VNIEDVYKCLSESDRIRILNLLQDGPLCGCFVQEILGVCQVKVSKQLAYLRKMGVVDSKREANWVVYKLATPVDPVLAGNLKLLRISAKDNPEFAHDTRRRGEILKRVAAGEKEAPGPVVRKCCCRG